MGTPEQVGSFFGLEQSNAKMQSEVIKVSDSKELLTVFSGLSNEDTQKAIKQFVTWMEKNNYNTDQNGLFIFQCSYKANLLLVDLIRKNHR
jgi:hypothetical protein